MLDSPTVISGDGREFEQHFAEPSAHDQFNFRQTAWDSPRDVRSIFDAQVWMGRSPWQPAAGWSVVAALLTWVPLTQWFGANSVVDWRLIALLLLLVDPLWGSIWRFSCGRSAVLALHAKTLRRDFWLPYLEQNSSATRLMGGGVDGLNDVYPLLLRVAVPSTLLALAVAAVLGAAAVGLTCVVVLLTVLAWTSGIAQRERASTRSMQTQLRLTQVGYGGHFLQAVIAVALPWGLALLLMNAALDAEVTAGSERVWFSFVLLLLWTLHSWGEGRCLQNSADLFGVGLLAVSNVGIALLLIGLGVPMALGILAIIWFATWYSIYRKTSLGSIQGWWLLATLVSAAAVGFSA